MAFYEFDQNNTGGTFETNDSVTHKVFIEADSAEEANKKAEEIGIYFNGCIKGFDCDCCGDRWYEATESDAEDEPTIYGKPLNEAKKHFFCSEVIVYYKNGTKNKVILKGE